jgi:spore germination cell wall hydrolase CwlJ-like protein
MASTAISKRYYNGVIISVKVALILLATIIMVSVGMKSVKYKLNQSIFQNNDIEIVTAAQREKELDCLSKNIYWEAASEPFEGKVAVAQVTLNRAESKRFGNGICGVVYQKNIIYEKVICQFSWVCEGTYKVKSVREDWYKESQEVAKKVLLENFRLQGLNDAMYYHASYVNPHWDRQKVGQIGQHIFYK